MFHAAPCAGADLLHRIRTAANGRAEWQLPARDSRPCNSQGAMRSFENVITLSRGQQHERRPRACLRPSSLAKIQSSQGVSCQIGGFSCKLD